jgi:osmotically-inducible protein OsmY
MIAWAAVGGWPVPVPGPPDAQANGDAGLAATVAQRIGTHRDGRRGIVVTAQNAVVILEGDVEHEDVRWYAGETAWRTPGVHDVNNRLRATRPGARR